MFYYWTLSPDNLGRLIGFAFSSFALLARDKMHKTHSGHYYFINPRGGKHWDICNMLLFHEGWGFSMLAKKIRQAWRVVIFRRGTGWIRSVYRYAICGCATLIAKLDYSQIQLYQRVDTYQFPMNRSWRLFPDSLNHCKHPMYNVETHDFVAGCNLKCPALRCFLDISLKHLACMLMCPSGHPDFLMGGRSRPSWQSYQAVG